MGFFDKAKAKLTEAVDQHGDKISDGLDKAAAAADKKTGGKYSDKIDTAVGKAKEGMDKLDGQKDDFGNGTPPADRPTTPPTAATVTPPVTPPADTPPAP